MYIGRQNFKEKKVQLQKTKHTNEINIKFLKFMDENFRVEKPMNCRVIVK
jgi:hypothetical protein